MSTIFVFGSNLAGRHGAGSARHALRHHGAIYGNGIGFMGSCYAIPTKDTNIRTLPLDTISKYIDDFLVFARNSPDLEFEVVDIGCGLAGYTPQEIAPLFKTPSKNVRFLGQLKNYVITH